jgi:hypothetical protein
MDLNSFAPAVLVRACNFPIEALEGFGDGHLAKLAVGTGTQGFEDFTAAYEQVLAREREALWRETSGSSHFLKALALTNPGFAKRARQFDIAAPRRRQARRLEVALYRYLARAVGRSEPCDLWSGVALANWGPRTRVTPAPAQYAIAPDLRPFGYIVRQLAQRACYRDNGLYRANATLARQANGGWTYWARTEFGTLKRRQLAGPQGLDGLLERMLPLPALTQAEIAAELGIDIEALRTPFATLVACGAVVGGLALPTAFESVWHALDEVEQQLESDDRAIWHSHVVPLRALCGELERQFESLDVDAVEKRVMAAADCVTALGRNLNIALPPSLPRAALRCDLCAPFRIEFGPEMRRMIEGAVAEYDRHLETASPAGLFRQAWRRQIATRFSLPTELADAGAWTLPLAVPATWQALAAKMTFAENLAARVVDWEQLLANPSDEVVCADFGTDRGSTSRPGLTPLGCLVATLHRGDDGPRLRIRGALDDVTPLYARFANALCSHDANAALLEWVRAAFRRLEERFGLGIAELKGWVEALPNAAAGPSFAGRAVELWDATRGRLGLAHARLVIEDGVALLYLQGQPKPLLVFACTGANIASEDPFIQALLLTSFRDAPAAFQASSVMFASEIDRPRWSPRVALPGGSVVRARRMVVHGEALAELVGSRSAALRFAAWQRLATNNGWPSLLTLRRDNDPPLIVPRDSPLAVEAAFAGALDRTQLLVIEEFDPASWLTGPDGRHYTIEIVVPYERGRHALTGRGADAS